MKLLEIILFKMQYLNKDVILEISKYVLSYDLKNLFFAFPFLNVKDVYIKKREFELAIINEFRDKYLCLSVDMAIINILDSELRHYCVIHSIQERFPTDSKIKYQAELVISINPQLVMDFCQKLLTVIYDIEKEFKLQFKNAYLHFWIKNKEEINLKLKKYLPANK